MTDVLDWPEGAVGQTVTGNRVIRVRYGALIDRGRLGLFVWQDREMAEMGLSGQLEPEVTATITYGPKTS